MESQKEKRGKRGRSKTELWRDDKRRERRKKKVGWGNDCSNHRLQVDVLSGAAVNLSVNLCVHRSRCKPLKYWLQEGSHDMFTQKTNNYPFLLRLSQSNQSESILWRYVRLLYLYKPLGRDPFLSSHLLISGFYNFAL